MRPNWYQNGPRGGKEAEKKRKESREAQKVLSRASWERSGATSFDVGVPGRGSVDIAACFAISSRPCVSEGLGPKSKEKCCKVARFGDLAISLIFASW